MAYDPNPILPVRDQIYVSKIAAGRPAFATRLPCVEPMEREASIRGSAGTDQVARFNDALRAGHAWRNEGEE